MTIATALKEVPVTYTSQLMRADRLTEATRVMTLSDVPAHDRMRAYRAGLGLNRGLNIRDLELSHRVMEEFITFWMEDFVNFKAASGPLMVTGQANVSGEELTLRINDLSSIPDSRHRSFAEMLGAIGLAMIHRHKAKGGKADTAPNAKTIYKMFRKLKTAANIHAAFVKEFDTIMGACAAELRKRNLDMRFYIESVKAKSDPDLHQQFLEDMISITKSLNSSHQVRVEAADDQQGYHEPIKLACPDDLVNRVAWMGTKAGPNELRYLVLLKVLAPALTVAGFTFPDKQSVFYSGKTLPSRWNKLMANPNIAIQEIDPNNHNKLASVVIDPTLQSVLGEFPTLLDLIDHLYVHFPRYYNAAGRKMASVGGGSAKSAKGFVGKVNPPYTRENPYPSPFLGTPCSHDYDFGLIYPLFYAITAGLLNKNRAGKVVWVENPIDFAEKHLPEFIKQDYADAVAKDGGRVVARSSAMFSLTQNWVNQNKD
jgi:hypothetical protein